MSQIELTLNDWRGMASAPKTSIDVELRLASGKVMVGHWACNLSGEEQPAFVGWFVRTGNYYSEVKPRYWRNL